MTCLYLLSAKHVFNFPAIDMHVRSRDVSETIYYFDKVAVISASCTVYVKVRNPRSPLSQHLCSVCVKEIQGRHNRRIYVVFVLKKSRVAIISAFM